MYAVMRDTPQKKLAKFWYHLTLSGVRSTPIFCLSYADFFEKGFLLKTEMKCTMIRRAQWSKKTGSIHILLINQEIILSFFSFNVKKHPSFAEVPLKLTPNFYSSTLSLLSKLQTRAH